MRHIGDLLRELGFNPEAPLESQKAFVRHLIHQANLSENKLAPLKPEPPTAPSQATPAPQAKAPAGTPKSGEQLSFNFDDSKKTG